MEENLKIKSTLVSVYGLTDANFEQIKENDISLDTIVHQLSQFTNGITKTVLEKPATITDGIIFLNEKELDSFVSHFEQNKNNYSIEKFVPASGAASRMFQFLSEFSVAFDPKNESIAVYISRKKDNLLANFIFNLKQFPFYKEVYNRLIAKNADYDAWHEDHKNLEYIKIILDENEFDFASKPKGILPFHKYENQTLTPVEEHIKETTAYCFSNAIANLHFTISREHRSNFEKIIAKSDLKNIKVSFSEQLKNTDTIAVDATNSPLKDKKNNLVFRPGGHGALIYNLHQLNTDIVFIKNIDNVIFNNVEAIALYKKALAGYLIHLQNQIFSHLTFLDNIEIQKEQLHTISYFVQSKLNIKIPKDFKNDKTTDLKAFLYEILNRPIRVCGMVKNENEPGGGPFWIKEKSGKISLQIVELSQIDNQDKQQIELFKSSSHFNPVDIVCGLKNYKGDKFNLLDYVDNNSGFIVEKSKNGINYKAYELPGLWNGAMANWITIFVEVPLLTFNPVKTVNDLLKNNHQF